MDKDILRARLDSIKLSVKKIDNTKTPKSYDKYYLSILEELSVKSRSDLDELRTIVDEKIVQMSDEIRIQIMKDVISGKITDTTKIPLYRENGTVRNIPDSLVPWISFMVWLNERRDDLFTKQ